MLRQVGIIAGFGGAVLAGGCADIMSNSSVSQIAPGWFAEKAVEVKGQGYPKLSDIPETRQVDGSKASWDNMAAALKDRAVELEARLKAAETARTEDELRATAAQWRACVEEKKTDCGAPDKPGTPPPGQSGR